MQFQFSQLSFPSDTEVVLRDVSWQDYEKFMAELGDRPALRIHYTDRSIHLMSPSLRAWAATSAAG